VTKKPAGRRRSARAPVSLDDNPVIRGGMPQALGMRITSVTRKKVTGEMTITPMHLNLNGRVNGGAIMAFADCMGAVGATANRPPGYRGGTIESKTNFFAAGSGPVLSAVSIPLHVGRTTSVWQTTIRNADGRMVAMVTQTQIAMPSQSGGESGPGGESESSEG
jgi:uncharacterized protein (TIGR00369 family)